jgi:metallo-beta-lactamase family protein
LGKAGNGLKPFPTNILMNITFLGAAGNVTGSRFLLETKRARILVDCGLFQEHHLLSRNWEGFAVPPATIDALLLTHAHIDHCGYIPRLVRDGFRGTIYCTRPTADIAKVSLLDTAQLQEADAAQKRKRHKKEGREGKYPEQPLFTESDAAKSFKYFKKVDFERLFQITEELQVTYYPAGHILGAAMIELNIQEGARNVKVVFSGDIGRWERPLLKDPHLFKNADYVVMEATYGGRLHEGGSDSLVRLEQAIHRASKTGGNVIIPTFAIGRTQELLYDLNQLLHAKRIPPIPVFVDSPMAMEVTEIFRRYGDYFDQEAKSALAQDLNIFDFPSLTFVSSPEESKALNGRSGTSVIMAGSGMCTGGRIKHHILHNISRPQSTILFVGYQAIGTLGCQILEKPKSVRIFGAMREVRANIKTINGFSAHADQAELLKWAKSFQKKPRNIFIVHAEPSAAETFVGVLRDNGFPNVNIAQYLQSVEL